MIYDERLKAAGLPATEISRVRQYERFIGEAIEDLRMVKMYRTPQSLRSFARLFTTLLPAFYAPAFAQVGIDLNSLGLGIAFAIITSLGLTALFESIQVLEDPFVAFITLDGIGTFDVQYSVVLIYLFSPLPFPTHNFCLIRCSGGISSSPLATACEYKRNYFSFSRPISRITSQVVEG
jgi:hypothetical protein